MKKVIDGKVYNTETAERIFSWDNGRYGNDFRNRSKDLYRTKKGNYFIYHSGGPMTDMAISVGSNSTSGSSDIEAITTQEAIAFLQGKNAVEILERLFPETLEEA